jgi:hypothetical protein
MPNLDSHPNQRAKYLLFSFLILSSCTITADDVEPALPAVPVYNSNTVVYRYNGLPVVAHNSISLIRAIFPIFSGPPVEAYFDADSALVFRSYEGQNFAEAGSVQHRLEWRLANFRGVGSYRPDTAYTTLQLYTRQTNNNDVAGVLQPVSRQQPGTVSVTAYAAAQHKVRGTFVLHFPARAGAPEAVLTEGAFDLTLTR